MTFRPYDLQTFRPYDLTTFPRNFFHVSRVFSLQVVWYLQDFFSKFASPKKRKAGERAGRNNLPKWRNW